MAKSVSSTPAADSRTFPAEAAGKRGITEAIWTALVNLWPTAPSTEVLLTAWDTSVARGWDPLKGHAALVEQRAKDRNNNWYSTFQVWPTLKSLIHTAHRTNAFAGMDPVQFGPTITKTFTGTYEENGRNTENNVELTFPEWVSCTVYRIVAGQRYPFTEVVYFEELAAMRGGLPSSVWRGKPRLMLMKCAKSAALRTAFAECDYSADEMDGQSVEMGEVVQFAPRGGAGFSQPPASGPVAEKTAEVPDENWGAGETVDRGDGEPYSSFAQVGTEGLYWLTSAMKTAMSIKAFGPAIVNMKATLPREAHVLGERLFEAAKSISVHKSADAILGYIEKASSNGDYGPARNGMKSKLEKSLVDRPTYDAVLMILDFNEAVDQSSSTASVA